MVETYARPGFGEPREPKNRVNPGSRLVGVIDFATGSHMRATAFLVYAASCCSCRESSTSRRSIATRRGSPRPPSKWSRPVISSTFVSRTTCATRSRSASTGCRRPRSKPLPRWAAARPGPDLALSRPLADRRDRRRAADLLDGAGLRDSSPRRAGRAHDGRARCCSASRPGSPTRTPCADHGRRRDGRDGAGLSVWQRGEDRASNRLAVAGDLLDRDGRRRPAEGTVDPDVRGATIGTLAILDRSAAGSGGCVRSGA